MLMRKLKLYLETSVWNFFFADDAPEKKEVTKEFFDLAHKGVYEIYISNAVLTEIDRAPQLIKRQLEDLIGQCRPKTIEVIPEMEDLAGKYIEDKIVPEKKWEDALHVAVATVAEVDLVITWNYRHLANFRKSELFNSVNLKHGYIKTIGILTPMEVMSDEN